jgi:hypothetical protein
MSGTIKWRQPKAAADLTRSRSGAGWNVLPAVHGLMLAGLLIALYVFLTTGSTTAIHGILTFGGLDVAVAATSRWLKGRRGVTYEVGRAGLGMPEPLMVVRWRWHTIEAYELTSHPDMPGFRCLAFKAKRSAGWNMWFFDPFEVDESALCAILEEHLPGKRCEDVPAAGC